MTERCEYVAAGPDPQDTGTCEYTVCFWQSHTRCDGLSIPSGCFKMTKEGKAIIQKNKEMVSSLMSPRSPEND